MVGKAHVVLSAGGIPDFSYSGTFEIVNDNGTTIAEADYKKVKNWNIKLKSSGTLKFTRLRGNKTIDVFLVGGGGSGGYVGFGTSMGTGGGGGGEAITILNQALNTSINYSIVVAEATLSPNTGSGGATPHAYDGNSTIAFEQEAKGGKQGGHSSGSSGGASGGTGATATGAGGRGGERGDTSSRPLPSKGEDGVYAFGETDYLGGYRFGAGGGGGGSHYYKGASGGITGGGEGVGAWANPDKPTTGSAGQNNSGGGGGGGGALSNGWGYAGKAGGSGIVIIRNHRK